ncbi:restriction endonuclease subunit S [Microbispora sp. NPDC049125]|uniref:restriction endonuclease subunit S n=1 Tax=Microbispora sp. NPDC049125 TaxID=3154929 RepID=UPI0034661E55
MSLPERPLGDVIQPAIDEVLVDPEKTYSIGGVYSFGRGLFRREPIKGVDTSYKTLNRLHSGRLVMSRLKAFEGAIALVAQDFDGYHLSPEFPTFEIDRSEIDERYLAHICTWPELWNRLSAESKGLGARKVRVGANRLLSINIPLPDLPEQRRIAARLDSAVAKINRVEQLYEHRIEIKSALAESLIAQALSEAQDEVVIGEIIELIRRPVEVKEMEGYREIGLRSFGKGVFHKEPITGAELGGKRVFHIEPGDLLFSSVFAWEGAVALAGESERGFIGSHRFMTYQVNPDRADPAYLRHFFTATHGLEILRRASPGSAGRNKTLGIKNLEGQMISLPPKERQEQIGRQLDKLASMNDRNARSELTKSLRASLVDAALKGRL